MALSPVPLKKFEQLFGELGNLASGVGRYADVTESGRFEALMSAYDALQKVEAHNASILKALLNALAGDIEQVDRWLRNVEQLGYRREALFHRLQCYSVMGYAVAACKLAPSVYEDPGSVSFDSISLHVIAAGGFHIVTDALQKSIEERRVIRMTNAIESFKAADVALRDMNAPENLLPQIYDLVGELLRARGLMWLGGGPQVHFFNRFDGGPTLHADFKIATSVAEAADLGWELTEKLVERDLDRFPITIGFLGTSKGL